MKTALILLAELLGGSCFAEAPNRETDVKRLAAEASALLVKNPVTITLPLTSVATP